MKATVIVDNIEDKGLSAEWGLSIYIEYEDKRILLDTGASDLFLHNAEELGVDLKSIDYAILSHAHYDHSNGMEAFFNLNKNAKFYIQEGCKENCYKKDRIFYKYIGIPKGITAKFPNRLFRTSVDYKICDGVYLIPHKTPNLCDIGKNEKMFQRKGFLSFTPDDFCHEQSLVFETDKGLVIFNSCSHGGAANIIKEVTNAFPNKPVYAIIGGFHLYNKSKQQVCDFAKDVRDTGIKYICTGHCTGQAAYDILKEELGEIVHQLKVGLEMEF